jgi:hypothetical protein
MTNETIIERSPDEETRAELVEQAKVLGVPAGGTKKELQHRITARVEGIVERAQSVTADEYRVGEWKGLPNFECIHCDFASLRRRRTILHIAEMHAEG